MTNEQFKKLMQLNNELCELSSHVPILQRDACCCDDLALAAINSSLNLHKQVIESKREEFRTILECLIDDDELSCRNCKSVSSSDCYDCENAL
jgi:hypothetical protein